MLSLAGIGIGPKTRYYGVCLQLWEVEPVRYLRTIPVAWLTYEELPDDIRSDKRSAYEAIRTACESLAPDTHGPPSLTAEKYTSDPARQGVSTIHWDFAEQVLSEIVWADDEQSFWVRTHGFWSWAGVDGTSSPRIAWNEPAWHSAWWFRTLMGRIWCNRWKGGRHVLYSGHGAPTASMEARSSRLHRLPASAPCRFARRVATTGKM